MELKKYNKMLYNFSILKRIFIKKGLPIQFTHFITARCNLRCNHCFYWKKINKEKNELTLEEITKISKSMKKIFFLLIGGGEPFLRKDLPEIIKIYYENNNVKNVSIPTNGTLTKKIKKMSLSILSLCPNISLSITISLLGLEKTHDLTTNMKGTFKKAIKTYKELKKIKNKNFFVNIQTTITKKNQNELKSLYNYIKNKLEANVFTLLLIRGNPKNPKIKNINIKIYEKINKLIDSKDKYKNQSILLSLFNYNKLKNIIRSKQRHLRYNLILKILKKNNYITPCYALQLDAVMYENGDIFPCELLNIKIGNMRDFNYDFKKLWYSIKAKKIRKYIKKTKCFCIHECNLRTNTLFNIKYLFKLLFTKV